MRASGIRTLAVGAAFVALALADVASATERGDSRLLAGPWMTAPDESADGAGAADREGVPEEMGDRGADGSRDPASVQGEDDPQGEDTADRDERAVAAGPHVRLKVPGRDDGAPGAQGGSAHARAPPEPLPATPTDPGA